MYDMKISDSVVYIGVDDKDIDLFESQYKVPNGVTYNSYVILDEKIAVMDTVDKEGPSSGWTTWRKYWTEENQIIWWYPIWSRTMLQISSFWQRNTQICR